MEIYKNKLKNLELEILELPQNKIIKTIQGEIINLNDRYNDSPKLEKTKSSCKCCQKWYIVGMFYSGGRFTICEVDTSFLIETLKKQYLEEYEIRQKIKNKIKYVTNEDLLEGLGFIRKEFKLSSENIDFTKELIKCELLHRLNYFQEK